MGRGSVLDYNHFKGNLCFYFVLVEQTNVNLLRYFKKKKKICKFYLIHESVVEKETKDCMCLVYICFL